MRTHIRHASLVEATGKPLFELAPDTLTGKEDDTEIIVETTWMAVGTFSTCLCLARSMLPQPSGSRLLESMRIVGPVVKAGSWPAEVNRH